MTHEQWDYEMGYAAQAEAEAQAEMEYHAYLDRLIENKQYELLALEIALDMLNRKAFADSGMSAKDWLNEERKRLFNIQNK